MTRARLRLFAWEVRALSAILLLAALFFTVALVAQTGGFIVKRAAILLAACAAGAALSGCTTLGRDNSAELLKQIDANFAQCERHITFQAGVGVVTPGAQVSGSVDCKGQPAVSVPVSAPAP